MNADVQLPSNFLQHLRELGIRVQALSPVTLVLHDVPLDVRVVSKPRTRLCVARADGGERYTAWADADLLPRDPRSAAAALLSRQTHGSWQLVANPFPYRSAQAAIEETMETLNTYVAAEKDTSDVTLGPTLARVSFALQSLPPPTLHTDLLDVAVALADEPGELIVIAGFSGSGLTLLARQVALRGSPAVSKTCLQVDCALAATSTALPTSTDERFRQLLTDCLRAGEVRFLFDNLQWLLRAGPLAEAALVAALDRGLDAVATYVLGPTEAWHPSDALVRRMHWIALPEADNDVVYAALRNVRQRLIVARPCEIPCETLHLCRELTAGEAGPPDAAVRLLQRAARWSWSRENTVVSPDDVTSVAGTFLRPISPF
jgi:hypothetical protein